MILDLNFLTDLYNISLKESVEYELWVFSGYKWYWLKLNKSFLQYLKFYPDSLQILNYRIKKNNDKLKSDIIIKAKKTSNKYNHTTLINLKKL